MQSDGAAAVKGRITATVLRARNVPKAKVAGSRRTLQCVLSLPPDISVSTLSVQDNANPSWEQNLTLNITHPFLPIELCLRGDSGTGDGELIGSAPIDPVELSDQAPHERFFRLTTPDANPDVKAEVLLRLQYKIVSDWELLYQGPRHVLKKEYIQAVEHLTPAIQLHPQYHQLLEYRSLAFLQLKRLREAIIDALALVDAQPNQTLGYAATAKCYLLAGETGRAWEYFAQGLKINPNEPAILKEMDRIQKLRLREIYEGVLAHNAGDYSIAARNFNMALTSDPSNHLLYSYRSRTLLALHKYAEATADAMKVTDIRPDWPHATLMKEGYLSKSGVFNVKLQRRWFVLAASHFLYYYKHHTDPRPTGVVCLHDFKLQYNPTSPKKFTLEVPGRVYEFLAETPEDGRDWCRLISAVKAGHPLQIEREDNSAMLEDIEQQRRRGPPSTASVPISKPASSSLPVGFADLAADDDSQVSASLGLNSALAAAESLESVQAEPVRPAGALSVNDISSSESRYYKSFGMLPPSLPTETTSLLPSKGSVSAGAHGEEGGCCCCVQ
jgi:tetratricopeptide (TPR) repeat protein